MSKAISQKIDKKVNAKELFQPSSKLVPILVESKREASKKASKAISKDVEEDEKDSDCDEDENDQVVPSSHWESVCKEVPPQYKERKDEHVVYMARIWIRKTNEYCFKIGYTNIGLFERMKSLDSSYKCHGRIIPISACIVKSQSVERSMHKKLIQYNLPMVINGIKHRELYKIGHRCYDAVIELMNDVSKNVWDSVEYNLTGKEKSDNDDDDDDDEDADDDYSEKFGSEELDQDSNEDAYWLERIYS